MKNITFIKIGGSLITDKTKAFSIKQSQLKQTVKEIAKLQRKGEIIIGNGAGSFAHTIAKKYESELKSEILTPLMVAEIQHAAAKLNRLVVEECLKAKIPAISIHPSNIYLEDNLNLSIIIKTLEKRAIPVVYGDIVWTKNGARILSTEKVFLKLIEKLISQGYMIKRVILLTDVDGVYDKNKNLIPQISKENIKTVEGSIKKSKGIDVTGGMIQKVNDALNLVALKTEVLIVNGEKKGNIVKAFNGENIGTKIK